MGVHIECICVFHQYIVCNSVLASRWCKGCKLSIDMALFRYDAVDLCTPCTYAIQSCHRIAKSQGINSLNVCSFVTVFVLFCSGEDEWLTTSLHDSEQCHIIVKSYKDHRRAIDQGSKLPEKWPLLEVKQSLLKTSSTDVRAEGELIHRRRFLL